MQVREATRDDWEDVKELLAELGRPDVRDDSDEQQHRARFEQYLARDDALALVADPALPPVRGHPGRQAQLTRRRA